jgi:endonuclease III
MDFGTMLEGFRFGAPGSPSPLKRAKTAPKPEVGSKIDNEIEESWHISDSEGDVGEGNDDVAGTATSQEATGATSPIDTRNHETQKSVTLEENNKTGAVAGDVRDDENRTATDDAALTYGDCVDADESLMRVTPPATTSSGKRNNFFLPKGHPGRPNEPAPAGWREVLDTITDHRATQPPAPVDAFHAFLLSLRTAPDAHFQALVASLLSVQCLDSVALRATKLLRERLGGEITVSAVHSAPLADVLDAISTCNFKNSKAKYVKQCASMVKIKFNGKVPQSISDLQSLPGVGPKLARLLNSVAFGNDDAGIVVDTHVRRVAGRLGWTCLVRVANY